MSKMAAPLLAAWMMSLTVCFDGHVSVASICGIFKRAAAAKIFASAMAELMALSSAWLFAGKRGGSSLWNW